MVALESVSPIPLEAVRPTQRLERALQATLKRNQERPHLDASEFDASAMTPAERAALVSLVTQMEHIESKAPVNLGAIARAAPLAEVHAC